MSKETSTLKGIENGRAEIAFEYAKKASDKDFRKEYKSRAKNLPMMIKTNGLGAALAFLWSKREKEPACRELYENIKDWITNHRSYLIEKVDNTKTDFTDKIVSLESTPYRAVTIEVLALMSWIRRFADGLIKGDD